MGFAHRLNSWPCACYPTFAVVPKTVRTEVQLVRLVEGREELVPLDSLRDGIRNDRLDGLIRVVFAAGRPGGQDRARALGLVLAGAAGINIDELRLYQVTRSVLPGEAESSHLARVLVVDFGSISRSGNTTETPCRDE